jgi:hypothetical protein
MFVPDSPGLLLAVEVLLELQNIIMWIGSRDVEPSWALS